MKTDKLIFVFCVLALLASSRIALAQTDQVYSKSGSSINGKIVETTPIQVTIEVQGTKRDVKVNDIRRVMFADDPPDLHAGRAKILAGKLDSGFNDLKKVNPRSVTREIVRRDLQFYLAFCEGKLALSTGGNKAKASESMLAFVSAVPNSYHFFAAAELLGDLAVGQEDYPGAVKYYGTIASRAPFPEYKMRGLIAEARAWVAQMNFAEAQKKFDAVLAINSDTPESKRQKLLAQIGKGRCLAETSTPEEGIQLIEQIIADNDPSDAELFGRAYNAQGDCLLKAGKRKDALMAYLHVDVLFYSHPDIHAESLYHLSKLWAEIKKSDRAVAARNLLNDRYAGSIWSKKE